MASTDRPALIALFRATGGANWYSKMHWDSDPDVRLGVWTGVRVNDEDGVVEVNLNGNNLKGPIPEELGALIALRHLTLRRNQLIGPIPKSLRLLSNLTILHLSRNELSGSIPEELGFLTKLEELGLSYNQLRGSIPKELGALTKLKALDLQNNKLTGHIPEELSALSNLKRLALYGNELTGPIPHGIGNLSALEDLYLSHNRLNGSIPKTLGALSQLKVLELYDNKLAGVIPRELAALTKLTMLGLHDNDFTGLEPPAYMIRNTEGISRWAQMIQGQTEDVVTHSWAWRAVEVLTSLWHFWLPVLDDATDMWLLWETYGDGHCGLWWTCLFVFVLADIERVYTAILFVALVWRKLVWLSTCCWCLGRDTVYHAVDVTLLASQPVDLSNCGWLMLDSLLWTLFGSRARSSPLMQLFGLAGDATERSLQESGLGFHAIDVMLYWHPFRLLGEAIMSSPQGHRHEDMARRNMVHRRKMSMVRAVGETLCVDSLFLVLSLVTGGMDDNVTGLPLMSALFSVLELVTELQYYVTEVEAPKVQRFDSVGDVTPESTV